MDGLTAATDHRRGVADNVATDRIITFFERYSLYHLYLAYHAALPLVLTPDLLYHLWSYFVPRAPWVAVADVLLSPLCNEVGHELYEMDPSVRANLLEQMRRSIHFGRQRIDELATIVIDYARTQEANEDQNLRHLSKSHRWTALAFLKPKEAAYEIATAFQEVPLGNRAEVLRVTSVVDAIAEQLAEYPLLLQYSRMRAIEAYGDGSTADRLRELTVAGNPVELARVYVPLPNSESADEESSKPQLEVYPFTPPISPDAAVIAKTERLLSQLPITSIPDPGPLPPGSRMPLAPNPVFVRHAADFQALAALLKEGRAAVITGYSGMGKTQLAVEFAHRYGQYFGGGVFWLNCADPATMWAEVAACGRVGADGVRPFELGEGFDALTLQEQVAYIRTAWEGPLPRLLVFDNCEDETVLQKWRPTTGGSRVVVTSRREEWKPEAGVHLLRISALTKQESIALLRGYTSHLAVDDPNLGAIVDELDNFPLALHLAGSFLRRYRHDVSPAQYLVQLREPGLLDYRSLAVDRLLPTAHLQDVARTFALSYKQLKSKDIADARARALLARASNFAPGEAIPRDLLLATLSRTEALGEGRLRAEDALRRLAELGLLEEAKGSLRLHQLLAAFVRQAATYRSAETAVEEIMLAQAEVLNDTGYPAALLPLQRHLRVVTDTALAKGHKHAAALATELGWHLYLMHDHAACCAMRCSWR